MILADGCPTGQNAYRQPVNNAVQNCQLGQLNTCPTGYSCQYSTQFTRYQCCGQNAGMKI
ncbi:MAG: hypothetical protein GY696_41080 [Gammaproteobacteria bacterium]|nr:hypothetical protein [Gammaproteobacteria bacterium]